MVEADAEVEVEVEVEAEVEATAEAEVEVEVETATAAVAVRICGNYCGPGWCDAKYIDESVCDEAAPPQTWCVVWLFCERAQRQRARPCTLGSGSAERRTNAANSPRPAGSREAAQRSGQQQLAAGSSGSGWQQRAAVAGSNPELQ